MRLWLMVRVAILAATLSGCAGNAMAGYWLEPRYTLPPEPSLFMGVWFLESCDTLNTLVKQNTCTESPVLLIRKDGMGYLINAIPAVQEGNWFKTDRDMGRIWEGGEFWYDNVLELISWRGAIYARK